MNKTIDQTFDAQMQSLKELISIPSVSRGDPLPGMPLGKNIHEALTYTLDLAKRLGFPEAKSLDGYCGIVDYGTGDEMLMIMAHLDVVPAGPAWSSDPFKAEIRNGRLYGRGVIDDKSAAISALYALHAVKQAGVPLKRRVRILLGCDEEKGWACIDRYLLTEPEPEMAFTPDGQYPVVNSEMSICQTIYEKKLSGSDVAIDCGVASNVIPGEALAVLHFDAVPVKSNRLVVPIVAGKEIRVVGRGGHAAQPDLAQNALLYLLDALAQQPLDAEDLAVATALNALLGHDLHGEGLGLDITDESGHLTLSPNILKWDENGVKLTLDCRYPFSLSHEQLLQKLDAAFSTIGFTRTFVKNSPGHLIAADSELVKTLLSVYEKNIGHAAKPLSIGGGTYARAFKNAVAFGLEPENGISECHMPDESIGVEDIRFNTLVMAEAIEKLAGQV